MTDDKPDIEQFKQETKKVPITSILPAHLKDPANYYKIKKAIIEAGRTKHSHGEVVDWAACATCQRAEWKKKEFMYAIGFTSGRQYLAWEKVMVQIPEHMKVPLPKYNSKK